MNMYCNRKVQGHAMASFQIHCKGNEIISDNQLPAWKQVREDIFRTRPCQVNQREFFCAMHHLSAFA